MSLRAWRGRIYAAAFAACFMPALAWGTPHGTCADFRDLKRVALDDIRGDLPKEISEYILAKRTEVTAITKLYLRNSMAFLTVSVGYEVIISKDAVVQSFTIPVGREKIFILSSEFGSQGVIVVFKADTPIQVVIEGNNIKRINRNYVIENTVDEGRCLS
jgi:hypothetical protein